MTQLNDVMKDEALIALVAAGDKEAFNELVGRNMKPIYALAYRMCFDKDDAEDITQETFLRLWLKAHTFNPNKGAKVGTWLYSIAYRLCVDLHRKQRHVSDAELQDVADIRENAEQQLHKKNMGECVKKAIRVLPVKQRAALVLCHYEGLSNKQAANTLHVSVKSVESLLVRARKALRVALEKQGVIKREAL